jgi:hypothetical protein
LQKFKNHVGLNDDNLMCADKHTFCKNTQTCCQLSDNTFGCCPLPNAGKTTSKIIILINKKINFFLIQSML